ncbi:MAG: hypothetical protein ABIK09_06855 [Pseudomonadota bacterium]
MNKDCPELRPVHPPDMGNVVELPCDTNLVEDLPEDVRDRLLFILSLSMFRTKRAGPRQRRKKSPTTSS